MTATTAVFYLINILPAPIWATWVGAPRSRLADHFTKALWPWAVLAVVYTALIGSSMFIFGGAEGAGMGSLAGVMRIFDSEWATLAGWTHYVCFDLFVARWIMNDAERSHRLAPILALTCFFGPVGLLLYLALRPKLHRRSM